MIEEPYQLYWRGPFSYFGPDSKAFGDLVPPSKPGIYLWVIKGAEARYISYVGQTGNLRQRFYVHMVCTLGGGYILYDVEELEQAKGLSDKYKPKPEEWNKEFCSNHNEFAKIALENLRAYELFYAALEGSTTRREREIIESCIIQTILNKKAECGRVLQNDKVSIRSESCTKTSVLSEFPNGVWIAGMEKELSYGVPDLDESK